MSEPSSTIAQITSDVANDMTVEPECVMLAPNRERKRRITSGPDLVVILLSRVIACDVHIAEHGTSQHEFEELLAIF